MLKRILFKFADWSSHLVLILFMLGVIFTAIISSLARYYIPNINEYKQDIELFLEEKLPGYDVSIGSIQGSWQTFKPYLQFDEVTVKNPDKGILVSVNNMEVELHTIKSLVYRQPYFDRLKFDAINVHLTQDDSGTWRALASGEEKSGSKPFGSLVDILWSVEEFSVRSMDVALLFNDGVTRTLPLIEASMSTYLDEKTILASVSRHIEQGQEKHVLGHFAWESKHQPGDEDFAARAYFESLDFPLSEFALFIKEYVTLDEDASLSGQVWYEAQGQKGQIQGELKVDGLLVDVEGEAWSIQDGDALFYADLSDEDFSLKLPRIELELNGDLLSFDKIGVSYTDHLEVIAKRIDVEASVAAAMTYVSSEKARKILSELSPEGQLFDVVFTLDDEKQFELYAEVDSLSVQARRGVPAVSSASGSLYVHNAGGVLDVDSENIQLHFVTLYDEPVSFEHVTGQLSWVFRGDRVLLGSDRLTVDSQYGQATVAFYSYFPKQYSEDVYPWLSLSVGLKDSHVKYRNQFIPRNVSEELQAWLDQNILDGDVSEAAFLYHGPIHKTYKKEKTVQLWLDLESAKVSYLEDWPVVADMSAQYLLDNGESEGFVQFARVGKVDVQGAKLSIVDKHLNIYSPLSMDSKEALSFLQNNGMQEAVGSVFMDWKMPDGALHGDITLSKKLEQGAPLDLQLSVMLEKLDISFPLVDIFLDNVSGKLHFDLVNGVSAKALTARLWGKKLEVSIHRDKDNTAIDFTSQVDMADLYKWSGQDVLRYAKGTTAFSGVVEYGGDAASISFSSDLKGVAFDLPVPLKKQAEEAMSLKLVYPLVGAEREVVASLGDYLSVKFIRDEQAFYAGSIAFLNQLEDVPARYHKNRITVHGAVDSLVADDWMTTIESYQQLSELDESGQEKPWYVKVDGLQVNRLEAFGQTLEDVKLDIFDTVAYWQIGVTHSDLHAWLKIFDDEQLPMALHMNFVNLDFLSQKQQESEFSLLSSDLSALPDIDVSIDKVVAGDIDYGEWVFELRPDAYSIALTGIEGSFRGVQIGAVENVPAKLEWVLGDYPITHFQGRFYTDDLSGALGKWGYSQEVNSRLASLNVASTWEGAPTDFDILKINADFKITLDKGNFASVSTTRADTLKLVSILNLGNIVRRLKLDFSDLTDTGLTFDQVKGRGTFNMGILELMNPIVIQGPSSEIRLSGLADINNDILNMKLGVTLPIASNIPWLAALAAGLPTAIGVYVVSKLMAEEVDALSSAVYSVTGTMDEPELKFVKLFDSINEEKEDEAEEGKAVDEL